MKLPRKLLPYVILVALLLTAAAAVPAAADSPPQGTSLPVIAQPTTVVGPESKVESLNSLVFARSYSNRKMMYNDLKQNEIYNWMDWSTDKCSAPIKAQYEYTFEHVCLMHDLSWRNLALIDQATGRVWNERNRYAADQQLLRNTREACDQKYPEANDRYYPGQMLATQNAAQRVLCKRIAFAGYYLPIRGMAGYRGARAVEIAHVNGSKGFAVIHPAELSWPPTPVPARTATQRTVACRYTTWS